jgi:glycerol-3-phosphate O-acyltransferase
MDKKLKLEGLPKKYLKILADFTTCYIQATGGDGTILHKLKELIEMQLKHPFVFEPYHQKLRKPFDYYKFSLDFIRPLVDLPHSSLRGMENLNQIDLQLKRNENVVLLANHQTEADPQAISVLLEKTHPHIAEKIIYVAGERVVTDPFAVPFSMGCDLLCIYSKRYIDHPPELKAQKQLHNKNTMELMSRLLKEGGKIIYVAPSGGRDRRNREGIVEVAPFDPQSIEMFSLMARKAKTPTHFYPFSLATYDLFPPPDTVQRELGETRIAKRSPIHLAFAPEFDMEKFPGSEQNDKIARRKARSSAIWEIVNANYQRIK